ncbi:MAG: serine hydrolase domain-containing protein [Verrucomicrobiota bacterium]
MELKISQELIRQGIEEGHHIGAQLSVAVGKSSERIEANFSFGEANKGVPMVHDSLCLWMSSSKPIGAVAMAQLWERDLFSLDDEVAKYWPEFGQNGKESITIRQLLTHTGGFRLADQAIHCPNMKEALEQVAAAPKEPRWQSGRKAGYHTSGSWMALGEIVHRLDGRPYQQYVREEIFKPLGMKNCWIGVPEEQINRYGDQMAVMHVTANGKCEPHDKLERSWEISLPKPGSHGRGPARELRLFYDMLIQGGRLGDARILEPTTVEAITAAHRIGMIDHTFRYKIDMGLGFIRQSIHYGELDVAYGFGAYASGRTFGHGGAESSLGFADPDFDLTGVFLFNGMAGDAVHQKRARTLIEAIYKDLELVQEDGLAAYSI